MRPRGRQNYILVLPSLFTTGNLFCGYFAILKAFSRDFEVAAYAILLAGVFDVLDGRVARLTRSTSKFGLEYDSIADVVSFGIAPAMLAYVWQLSDMGRLGWASSFFFAACGALRLARFNTISEELPKSYFLGLPIPAGANTVATTYLAFHEIDWPYWDVFVMLELFLLGFLMVSNIRYRSMKDFDLRHKRSFFILVGILVFVVSVVAKPELTLGTACFLYAIYGPIREILGRIKRPGRSDKSIAPHFVTTEEDIEKNGGR